jgi:enoyl-CoA hydratase
MMAGGAAMKEIILEGKGKNALGSAMMHGILDDIAAAAGQPLLLRGANGAFSAGLDLREVAGLAPDKMAVFLHLLENVFTTLYQHPAPTAALVNGHAIAGGCVLAMCCDVRIAAADPSIKIGLNEVALGVVFPPRTLAIVRSRLPPKFTDEVLLGAALYNPEGARAIGFVDEVSADAEALAKKRLEALAAHPRPAYVAVKRALHGGAPEDLATDDELERYLTESVPLWTGDALKAKIAALLGGGGSGGKV